MCYFYRKLKLKSCSSRLSSKLLGMFFGILIVIVPMLLFVFEDFVPDWHWPLLRRADMRELRRARTFWRKSARRSNPKQNPLVQTLLELSQRTCLPILSSDTVEKHEK